MELRNCELENTNSIRSLGKVSKQKTKKGKQSIVTDYSIV